MKSQLHKKMQEIVMDYYKGKENWIAAMEESIRGKKIDVLVQEIKSKYAIAHEIQTSHRYFLENIAQDFGVNCDEVRIVAASPAVLEKMKERACRNLDKSLLKRVRFQLIKEFIPTETTKTNGNTAEFNAENNPETNAGEKSSVPLNLKGGENRWKNR